MGREGTISVRKPQRWLPPLTSQPGHVSDSAVVEMVAVLLRDALHLQGQHPGGWPVGIGLPGIVLGRVVEVVMVLLWSRLDLEGAPLSPGAAGDL